MYIYVVRGETDKDCWDTLIFTHLSMTPQDHLMTAPTPQSTIHRSWRSGNLHHPGWRTTRVGPGQYPLYTRGSQSGRRLWVARKALHLYEPNHEGNGRSKHNMVAEPFHSQEPAQVSTVRDDGVCRRPLTWATRSATMISPAPCRRKHVAVQARVQQRQDARQQKEPDSEGAGGAEQSQFQPSVRSVLVAFGVFAGLKASAGTRRHQRSLFWGLHLWVWQRFRVEVNGKRQRDLPC